MNTPNTGKPNATKAANTDLARAVSFGAMFLGSALCLFGCAPTQPVRSLPTQPNSTVTTSAPVAAPSSPVRVTDNRVNCKGQRIDFADLLQPIVNKMVAQKIPYSQDPADEWRDCSGNFLRLSSYVAGRCPNLAVSLAAPAGIKDYDPARTRNRAPGGARARTTRQLAQWYHAQNRFIPIYYDDARSISSAPADLRAVRAQVQPGTVLWFAKRAPKKPQPVSALFDPQSAGRIVHMATVTAVRRDARTGLVTGFEMYHGRNTRHPGMVTKQHHWDWPASYLKLNNDDPSDDRAYPPFGNWSQFLVGIAPLVPLG